ncbi:MAG: zinc/iron-chelating domain-containing protein [Epsilonproteobacteria bacterium]|nr:zinc/iron-chelating domain-containing protein [Campylobacterota bacterium]NPA64184.1 YkgJ family cysteine cluster protein [Campylobacterota bacterium]
MSDLITKEGFDFAFDPGMCASCEGNCCRGESGYIWVTKSEIEQIARFLGITSQHLIQNYLKKVGYRYTIKEIKREGEYFCLFFDKGCQIYPVRPAQCRSYPFWDHFKNNKEEVCKECKGILPLS